MQIPAGFPLERIANIVKLEKSFKRLGFSSLRELKTKPFYCKRYRSKVKRQMTLHVYKDVIASCPAVGNMQG